MKILITAHFRIFPVNSGGAVRTFSIAQCLHDMGHEIILLTGDNATPPKKNPSIPGEWIGYGMYGQPGYFINPSFYQKYKKLLKNPPDMIIASCPYQSLMIVSLAKKKEIPIVYDAHNVEAERFRLAGNFFKYMIVRFFESYLIRNSRAVLAVSKDDMNLFSQIYGVKSILLPNGVDLEKFSPQPRDEHLISRYALNYKKVVIYFGSYDYPPNVEALKYLVQFWPELYRRDNDLRLLIVGRYPPAWVESIPGVVVAGAVDDIAAHIRLAHLVVVPLSHGGGTRLKILEALACGQTVLSTPFGAMGIDPDETQKALIICELNNFADKILALLRSPPEPCSNMISRELALKYDWRTIIASINWNKFLDKKSNNIKN